MLDTSIVKRRRSMTVEIALTLESGASLGLFGASGTGKSTVLSCIAGLEEPDAGHVVVGGVSFYPPSLPLHRRPIGYVTQDANLFPHLSVQENVRFGISGSHDGAVEQNGWVELLRERLGLGPFWKVPASRISGGQARRVALARMLARRPPLILLDEPFAGLDRRIVRELIDDLLEWQQKLGFSMIAVDHQPEVLQRLCLRAVVMENGKAVQSGTWAELSANPATPLLRDLLTPL